MSKVYWASGLLKPPRRLDGGAFAYSVFWSVLGESGRSEVVSLTVKEAIRLVRGEQSERVSWDDAYDWPYRMVECRALDENGVEWATNEDEIREE